jgi:regulator of sigma E protease
MDLLNTVSHGVIVGITFLIVITILVAVHELGHYWFAKLCGMHVEAFAVMVGGVRKTPLDVHLTKPLVPARNVWLIGTSIAVLTFLAGFFNLNPVFYGGLAFLAIGGPVWIITRLSSLYHRPVQVGILTLLKSWGVVAVILFMGTQFQNLDLSYALNFLLAGSVCAVLLVYYAPVLGAADMEGNKGRGEIKVDGQSIPVQYRPLLSKTNKEGTEFSLLLLPLGGFAAIKGMQPREDGSETKIDKGFFSRPPFQRLLVLFAGPLFSIIFGQIILFGTIMAQGIPGEATTTIGFLPTGPGKAAGLEVGDKITTINGQSVSNFSDIREKVRFSYDKDYKPKPINLTVIRDGQTKNFSLLPTIDPKPEIVLNRDNEPVKTTEAGKLVDLKVRQARIGFIGSPSYEPAKLDEAAKIAALAPVTMTLNIISIFTSFDEAKESVGGPAAMVQQTSDSVKGGFIKILELAALLSISLGIMNLLPIPPLDGGQMVIAFTELIRGNKRLPMNFQLALHNIGGFLVVLLMLAVFAIDAGRRSELNKIREDSVISTPEKR